MLLLNLPWNIASSILNKNNNKNPFNYFPENKAQQLVNDLYNTGPKKIPSILSVQKAKHHFYYHGKLYCQVCWLPWGEPV